MATVPRDRGPFLRGSEARPKEAAGLGGGGAGSGSLCFYGEHTFSFRAKGKSMHRGGRGVKVWVV